MFNQNWLRASRARLFGGVAFSALALWLGSSAAASALTFTQGDLVVSVEGNGSGTASGGTGATGNSGGSSTTYLDNQAAPLTLYEFKTTGGNQTAVGTLTLPQSTKPGGHSAVSGEYGSSSEAQLQLSGDGRYLTIAGYAINAGAYNNNFDTNGAGTALAQSCSLSSGCGGTPQVNRVIATINGNGRVNSTTVLSNVTNTNNPRSVYSADGKSFYVSGQGSGNAGDTTGGVFYVPGVGPGQTANRSRERTPPRPATRPTTSARTPGSSPSTTTRSTSRPTPRKAKTAPAISSARWGRRRRPRSTAAPMVRHSSMASAPATPAS